MSWPLIEIGAPVMEIGAEYNTRKRAPDAVAAFGSVAARRSFDRVEVYIYDASWKAFPGIARFSSR
jgi:hypothetical protein